MICDTIRRLPARVNTWTRDRAEAFLAAQARDVDTTTLGRVARRLASTLDPDGAALDDEDAVRAREVSLSRGVDGLCGQHHRTVHHQDWQVRLDHGLPEFIPPDPPRIRRRHTLELVTS